MREMAEKEIEAKVDDIEWISRSFNDEFVQDSGLKKLKRKCAESPMVPIGLCLTIGALSYGLYNFLHDRKMMQQYSMRARVFFQGVTLAALSYGMYSEGQQRMQRDEEAKAKANEKSGIA